MLLFISSSFFLLLFILFWLFFLFEFSSFMLSPSQLIIDFSSSSFSSIKSWLSPSLIIFSNKSILLKIAISGSFSSYLGKYNLLADFALFFFWVFLLNIFLWYLLWSIVNWLFSFFSLSCILSFLIYILLIFPNSSSPSP